MELIPLILSIPILITHLFIWIFDKLKINSLKRLFKSIGEKIVYIAFKK